jgi:hypothetical protein
MQVYYNYHARFDTEHIATGTEIGISTDMTVNSQWLAHGIQYTKTGICALAYDSRHITHSK